MVDDYSDIKNYYYNYISALFSTYSKQKEDICNKENTLFPVEYSYVVPDYIFNELDLFIVYRYIKYDNLIKLINDYNIEKIKTNEPTIFYSGLLNNIIHSYINLEFTNHLVSILCNMLVIGTKLSLTLEETKIILTYVSTLLKEGNVTSEIYKAINYFVVQIYKSGFEISELVYNIINIFTLKLLETNKNTKKAYEIDKITQIPYIKNLVFIFRELHISEILMDDSLIDKVIFNLLHGDLSDKKYDVIHGFLIPIHPLISITKKDEIETIITDELEKSFNIMLYVEACLNVIIKPNVTFEEAIYKKLKGFIENHNGEIISPDPTETHLRYVATLIYNKKIIDKDKFAEFVGIDNLFDFIFEPNSYQNYSDFELDWLKKFDNDYLVYISQIEKLKIGIGSKLKEEMMKKDIDKELKRIYFVFFDNVMA